VRIAAAIALALALAAPAEAAETVGHSAVTAGPVLAGGGWVLWGDAPSGRARVLARGNIAGFDLGPDRAVWAAGPPAGRRRIALERL